jgi:biopolymer transport protein TolR
MKSRNRKTVALRHEINVTPFVDVMLVLLVIFMVATPMMQSGVSVDLPRGQNSSQEGEQSPPLNISLDKTGQLFLREKKVKPCKAFPLQRQSGFISVVIAASPTSGSCSS